LMLSFVFVASSALVLSSVAKPELKTETNSVPEVNLNLPPVPVLGIATPFPIISGQAALAVDITSGITLYEKDPDKLLLPASTTKIVTALVAMDYYSDDVVVEVGRVKVEGQKMGLRQGEKISAGNLLLGLLVYSANDAAEVLAQNYWGGREAFIQAMNQKAKDLNLENSFFANPSGLDGNGDRITSTAKDLVRISMVAMEIPKFADIVKTKEITVTSVDGKISHKLHNINELVGQVDGVLGIKTGWTENARENLITYVIRDNHKVIIALLGSQDRFGETKELIDWIFGNYTWEEVNPRSNLP
ncbi:MAG: hypothetical protein Q8P91_02015, partial [bacterium]|nr:hypothetical protein [bacterium]